MNGSVASNDIPNQRLEVRTDVHPRIDPDKIHTGEKSKTNSDKKLSAVVRDYKQFLNETENTTLRTKLDQIQVGSTNYFLQRKLSKKGNESITSSELLRNIARSKTSLVSGPSGSGKSTLAANITVDWAESEDDSSYDVVLFLSSLNTTKSLPLHKLVWGEFASSTLRWVWALSIVQTISICHAGKQNESVDCAEHMQ